MPSKPMPVHRRIHNCAGGLLVWGVMGSMLSSAPAAPPDLTSGGVPPATYYTFNLGPTGARGWAYNSGAISRTAESRQILVTAVDAGSPAYGVLAVDDVILGADGSGAAPVTFIADARKSLAQAIAEAEARDPALLKLLRWRGGTTSTVQLTLQYMGSYSAAAPYNCLKSKKILRQGLDYLYANENPGRYSFGAIALLAGNDVANPSNAVYQAQVPIEAHSLIPTAGTMAQMMSDERDTGSPWQRGYTLVFLAEYYLSTGDTAVLPAIEAYAVNIARNQSLFGTSGHIFAEKTAEGGDNGPMGGVYGTINATGLPCFLGLLLARECGVTNAYLAPAIERTSRFFAYYTGKGSIPYGEHEPYWQRHENNGKNALTALAFSLQANRVEEARFFARMSTASANEREEGHTGAYFNFLWPALGAACGGEEAAAAFFSRTRWHYDLARRWDGSFSYDNINGEGPSNSNQNGANGTEYNNFRMSTVALLTYALPLRQLHITGKGGPDAALILSAGEILEATAADDFSGAGLTEAQLVTALGSWSPLVRRKAGDELGNRTAGQALVNELTGLANGTNGASRYGACWALGNLNHSSSANARALTLAHLLTDPDNDVRVIAAESLRYLSTSAKTSQLATILGAADTVTRPLEPFDEEDPLHFDHARIAMLLFYSGNAYGPKGILYNSLAGVDRNLLYPAIRAVAATPVGQSRSTLSSTYPMLDYDDTVAVADAVVESVRVRAPADKMFSSGVRQAGLKILQKYGFAEGVPLAMIYMEDDGRTDQMKDALGVLKLYAGSSTTVVPDPGVEGYMEALLYGSLSAEAQAVLDAIAADTTPAPLTPLKSILSVLADDPTLILPVQGTVLRVNAIDHARGDSIFTWRKVHGAGAVTFSSNGTGAASTTTLQLETIPGRYLIEVTMSDSRGLTEVSETVEVRLYNADGTLPPNAPPTAQNLQLVMAQARHLPIALTATDPEGYALVYTVTRQPANGSLSGSPPDFVYTPAVAFTGADSFSFEVMDSEGQVASATAEITIRPAAYGAAIYEPFDYPAGALRGRSGSTEFGLEGTWDANSTTLVISSGLVHGSLPVRGGSLGHFSHGQNHYGGARAVKAAALTDRGLLADGATLWFSLIMGYGRNAAGDAANLTNARLAFSLANSQFSAGNYDYWIEDEGAQPGSGLGVTLGRIDGVNGRVVATHFRDRSFGDGYAGNLLGDFTGLYTYGLDAYGLIVGKIVWGADSDTITLYQPGPDLAPGQVVSTLTTSVDQSAFDTITFARGDSVALDEIRFAATRAGVVWGTLQALPPGDYSNWAAAYPFADLRLSGDDWDGDHVSNGDERVWGLDPTSPAGGRVLFDEWIEGTVNFTYTRRSPSLSGLTYSIWTSTDLKTWAEDAGALQVPSAPDEHGVETVTVELGGALSPDPTLFIHVRAQ